MKRSIASVIATTLLLAMQRVSASETVPYEDFWKEANKTLDLKVLRQNLIKSDKIIRTAPPPPDTNHPILSDPKFLPLCGNGRLDTLADYAEYYKNKANLPLTLPIRQIDYTNTDYNVEYNSAHGNKTYNITISADEECDDGNRDDRDGCSADCMQKDRWTGACEIAFRIGENKNADLVYEDMIYDPVRKGMVVSAADGVYLFPSFEYKELQPEDYFVEAQLLAPKTFTGTTLFRHRHLLLLYSAPQQSFWQLNDGVFTLLLNFSNSISDRKNADWNAKAHYDAVEEVIVLYNSTTMVLLNASELMMSGVVAESRVQKKYCDLEGAIEYCFFWKKEKASNMFQCDPLKVVDMYTNSDCTVRKMNPDYTSNIWRDIMSSDNMRSSQMKIIPYNMNFILYPNDSICESNVYFQNNYLQIYHPLGGIFEVPLGGFRFMGSRDTKYADKYTVFQLMNYLGIPSGKNMIVNPDEVCGSDTCMFDFQVGYNPLASNPLLNAQNKTWNDILQEIINDIAQGDLTSPITNIYHLKQNLTRYKDIMLIFNMYFNAMTKPYQLLNLQRHPLTGNLWVIQRNKIIEISSSGVNLKRKDNGKCLPISIAVCDECQWATNGMKCRPCSEMDTSSWAWNLKCRDTYDACSGRRRALLQAKATTIHFVIKGNVTQLAALWPVSSESVKGFSDVLRVDILSTEPKQEMSEIIAKLYALKDKVVVITPPTVIMEPPKLTIKNIVNEPKSEDSKTEDEGLNKMVVGIVAVSLILLFIVILGATALINQYKPHSEGLEREPVNRIRKKREKKPSAGVAHTRHQLIYPVGNFYDYQRIPI